MNRVEEFLTFLRFPSVSADPSYHASVHDCAQWLCDWMQKAGLDSTLHPTAGQPVVVGRGPWKADRKTVLIYGHYDVQPPDPLDLWSSPPFEPTVHEGVVTARGAADNKGQIFAHLLGLRDSLQKNKELPVNVIVVIEGEEEVGSKNLETFLNQNRSQLNCDVIVVSDTMMIGRGEPCLTYATRGIVGVEFSIQGPQQDLHSGLFGGILSNPLKVISQLISTLYLPDGKIAVEGFYDGVQVPDTSEIESWQSLPLNESYYQNLTGVPNLEVKGKDLLQRLWTLPTLELNGVWGGYQGPGSKTVIPAQAHAKITCRLVHGQNPEKVGEKIEAHLRKHLPSTVQMKLQRGHGGDAFAIDPKSKNAQAAIRAMKQAFPGCRGYSIRDGATIPILSTFQKVLGVESLLVGLALPEAKIHSPNENFPLENLEAGMRLNQALLVELQ